MTGHVRKVLSGHGKFWERSWEGVYGAGENAVDFHTYASPCQANPGSRIGGYELLLSLGKIYTQTLGPWGWPAQDLRRWRVGALQRGKERWREEGIRKMEVGRRER